MFKDIFSTSEGMDEIKNTKFMEEEQSGSAKHWAQKYRKINIRDDASAKWARNLTQLQTVWC